MSITEYAAYRGCNPETVRNAILAGRILRNADGSIDPAIADRQWAETTREHLSSKPRTQPTGATEPLPGMLYSDARALKEVYEAQRRRLELQQRSGELVKRADVERAAFTRFRNIRDACFNIPARLSALLAAEKDEANVYALLEGELRRIFEDFADAKL